ncbi:hypothetical protein [Streptomyces sp. MZ04]|uniref:hypothetical protein n=1 Tax=Streptomyces sp. MZ04 TaxID=2559236 RepID=UPI00107E71D0|nr:hypothetical protein [Streptomyces sp. MZ04]TGB14405.1 hypothetical protein E2651_06155 [Streptomyces sp. MZ04]
MTPPAARAVIAAHLTDALDVQPHRATLTASELLDRLAIEGWEINSAQDSRPVAPRARETSRARRLVARLLSRPACTSGEARP